MATVGLGKWKMKEEAWLLEMAQFSVWLGMVATDQSDCFFDDLSYPASTNGLVPASKGWFMLSGYIWVTALTNEMTEMLANTNEQVRNLRCEFKNVLFFFLNIILMSLINRAIFNNFSNSSITSSRTAKIAQSTATSGNLMKMLGCEEEEWIGMQRWYEQARPLVSFDILL